MSNWIPLIAAGCAYSGTIGLNFFDTKRASLARVGELVNSKGVINLGSGCYRSAFAAYVCNLEFVKVNIDLADGSPKMLVADLESCYLPFGEKEFDVAYACHVLEHLNNWQGALDEWCRIADHVIVALPHPLSIFGRLYTEHKQHFSPADMEYMSQHWPSVEVFS